MLDVLRFNKSTSQFSPVADPRFVVAGLSLEDCCQSKEVKKSAELSGLFLGGAGAAGLAEGASLPVRWRSINTAVFIFQINKFIFSCKTINSEIM